MKTIHIILFLLSFFSFASYAQSFGSPSGSVSTPPAASDWTNFTPSTPESIDSVTIGSLIAYRAQEMQITNLLEYKWLFEHKGTNTKLNVFTMEDMPAIPHAALIPSATPDDDWYEWSASVPSHAVSVKFDDNSHLHQFVDLYVDARYVTSSSPCGSAKAAEERIFVIDRPKVAWNAAAALSFCKDDFTRIVLPADILSDVAGKKEIEIEISIEYFADYTNPSSTEFSGWIRIKEGASAEFVLDLTDFPFLNNLGMFEITVLNITDRISRKSLDMDLVKAQTVDLPSSAFKISVYPLPDADLNIQRIRNIRD